MPDPADQTTPPTPPTPPDQAEETRGHRVADQLAKDARAKEARMLPETGNLSDHQLDWIGREFTEYLAQRGLEPADVARQLGEPIVAVVKFVNGNYQRGGVIQLGRKLLRWVRQQQDADREGAAATYITTNLAEKMIAVTKATHAAGMMGVIVGPSGISKSTVCRAVESGIIPGSVHIELTMPHGRAAALARLLAKRTRCPRRTGNLAALMESLIDHLRDSGILLMIDEAHYLKTDGCQVLRDLHKQTGCPVVLYGTRDVLETINDFNQFTGQFKRLFSYTLNVTEEMNETGEPLYTPAEISKFAKSMGLRLTGGGLSAATELACLPGWGGLGSLRSLLLNAKALAGTDADGKPKQLTGELIRISLRQMEGATGFERVQTRTGQHDQRGRRKVAVA